MTGTSRTGTEDAARFFDEDYLRLLDPFYPEEQTRAEVAALRELIGLALDDRVLDLGCGWGRHLALLAAAGHPVIGLDLSHALLRHAARAAAARAPAGTSPRLVSADMRWAPFPGRVFDVILNLASSLGLFLSDDDALAALRESRRLLRPGGRLVIEGMHRDDVVANFAARDEWTLDDGTIVRARRRFDALRGVSHEVLRWRGPGREGEKRHSLRLRSATELGRLLDEAGYAVAEAWGGWKGEPFRRGSPRIIILAEPAAGA